MRVTKCLPDVYARDLQLTGKRFRYRSKEVMDISEQK
jgi:hypothetical protein